MDEPNSNNKDDVEASSNDNDNNDNNEAVTRYNSNNNDDESIQANTDDDEKQGPIISNNNNKTNDNDAPNTNSSNNNDDHHYDDEVATTAVIADVADVGNRKRRRSTTQKGNMNINNNDDESIQASATDDDEQGPISSNNKTNDDADEPKNDDNNDDEVATTAVVADVGNINRRKTNQKGDLPKIVVEQIISFIIERSTLTSTNTTTTATTTNTTASSTGTKSRPNTTNANTNTTTTTIDLYVPKRGTLSLAGKTFHTSCQNVSRIWLLAVKNKCNPDINDYILTSKRSGNPNGNRKWDRDELMNELKTLPYEQRSSFRIMSNALKIPIATLNSMLKYGCIRCYIAPDDDGDYSPADTDILPILNEDNMLQRIYYCYNRIHKLDGYDNNDNIKQLYYYDDRYNEIHLDQKWFYVKKKKIDHQERYYLTEDEPDPPPAPKRPRHQSHDDDDSKVMFLMAVARPSFDNDGNCIFDGKIGIWPIVYEENQQALDPYVPIKDVTANLYLYYMKYKVIPAIKQYFNNRQNMKIYIQHNNDSTIPNLDLKTNQEWIDFCYNEEIHNQWSFIINEQPSNSRDLNVCQFSFFSKNTINTTL